MGTHTPGPWVAERTGSGQWRVGGRSRNVNRLSARIAALGSPRSYESPEVDAEDEANARLIAAAPELLEALRACAEDVESWCDEHGHDASRWTPLVMARAAIAKATGGEQ